MAKNLVVEYHYDDGDVGVHPASDAEAALWANFSASRSHKPTHIVIRPDTDEGQTLSNRLHASADLLEQAIRIMPHIGPGYSGQVQFRLKEPFRKAIVKAQGIETT